MYDFFSSLGPMECGWMECNVDSHVRSASGKKNELLLWLLPTQKLDLACSSTKLTSEGRATMSLCFRKELTITNTNLVKSCVVKWLLFFCYSCQLWRCNVLVFCQSMDCVVLVAMRYSRHNSPDYADRYNEISTRMFLAGIMTMVVESMCSVEFGSSELWSVRGSSIITFLHRSSRHFFLTMPTIEVLSDQSIEIFCCLVQNASSSENDQDCHSNTNVQNDIRLLLVGIQSSRCFSHQTLFHRIRNAHFLNRFDLKKKLFHKNDEKWPWGCCCLLVLDRIPLGCWRCIRVIHCKYMTTVFVSLLAYLIIKVGSIRTDFGLLGGFLRRHEQGLCRSDVEFSDGKDAGRRRGKRDSRRKKGQKENKRTHHGCMSKWR